MKTSTRTCPGCGSDHVVRDGRSPNRKQRYWCRACNLSHRDDPEPRGYSEQEKEVILKAYQERTSLRGLERVFGVSRKTISEWLKKKPKRSRR